MATRTVTPIREVRKRLKSKGFHWEPLPDSSGPATTTYHDPETGQEFHRLPIDAWSLERYMKIHGWYPTPAPPELRKRWEDMQASIADPLDEYREDGERLVKDHADKVKATIGEDLMGVIQGLADEVKALKLQLGGAMADAPGPAAEEPIEPYQIPMFAD